MATSLLILVFRLSCASDAAICIDTDQKRASFAALRALQRDGVLLNLPAIPLNRPQQGSALVFNSSPRHCALTDGTDAYDLRSAVECGGGSQHAL